MNKVALIIHGGAGEISEAEREPHRAGMRLAAAAGWEVLQSGGSARDAVVAAIKVMEDDPVFDAGRGSYPNQKGEIEMDAILMDGNTLDLGAVAGIQRVRHPIEVARLVMEHTPHTLLAGAGAEAFARSMGVPACTLEDLLKPADLYRNPNAPQGTVGAVALDAQGHLVAATSTGGTDDKLPGRVGDSPLVGSGAYADIESGAASTTGHGEDLMKIVICKSACDLLAAGMSPQQAAEAVIDRLARRTTGTGGIIVMNPRGEMGCAFNTPAMARAWYNVQGELQVYA